MRRNKIGDALRVAALVLMLNYLVLQDVPGVGTGGRAHSYLYYVYKCESTISSKIKSFLEDILEQLNKEANHRWRASYLSKRIANEGHLEYIFKPTLKSSHRQAKNPGWGHGSVTEDLHSMWKVMGLSPQHPKGKDPNWGSAEKAQWLRSIDAAPSQGVEFDSQQPCLVAHNHLHLHLPGI